MINYINLKFRFFAITHYDKYFGAFELENTEKDSLLQNKIIKKKTPTKYPKLHRTLKIKRTVPQIDKSLMIFDYRIE